MATVFTHVNLPVADVEASIAWYEAHTPLVLQGRDSVGGIGEVALMAEDTDGAFVSLVQSDQDRQATTMLGTNPLGHLGLELEDRSAVDSAVRYATDADCLVFGPVDHPKAGYYCMLRDPDGNNVELSVGQSLSALLAGLPEA